MSELWIYPIKACRGIQLPRAELGPMGLAHDRRWMIVSGDGRFLSQREIPRLALIRPTFEGDGLGITIDGLTIALSELEEGPRLRVQVWRDEVEADAPSPEADAALSEFLGLPARLVRFPQGTMRACDPTFAPAGSHTAFADGFPVLVTNEASLDEVNAALAARGAPPVPMRRFRPSIVLAGFPAGAEDEHDRVQIGDGVEIRLVKPCDRCSVTTVDPDAGVRTGKEPLATLARLRRNPRTGGAWFGQNGVPMLAEGASMPLQVGMRCRLG